MVETTVRPFEASWRSDDMTLRALNASRPVTRIVSVEKRVRTLENSEKTTFFSRH